MYELPGVCLAITSSTDSLFQCRQVIGHERVFALGDVAVSNTANSSEAGQNLPATAQVAFQQADYVAWNLWSAINKKPLLSFSFQNLGTMMSLGSSSGSVALPIPLPPPLSTIATAGPLGQLLKVSFLPPKNTFVNLFAHLLVS